MSNRLEIPVFAPRAAQLAAGLGAHRIELNAAGSYAAGGLTPSLQELAALPGDLSIPVRVMIRPRASPSPPPDFIYSETEFAAGMRDAVAAFKQSGLLRPERGDGFVFGILKTAEDEEEGGEAGRRRLLTVDVPRNRELVELARPYPCVFHRAFDDLIGSCAGGGDGAAAPDAPPPSPHWSRALDQIVAMGFSGILTSGGPGDAPDNLPRLEEIVRLARGRIEIVIGGGVRARNIRPVAEALRVASGGGEQDGGWFHSSCLVPQSADEVDEREVDLILGALKAVGTP